MRSGRFLMVFPPFFWLLVFFVLPLLIVLVFSVSISTADGGVKPGFTLQSYQGLADPVYGKVFLKSVGVAGAATLLTLLVAYPMSYCLAFAAPRWKMALLFLIALPFFTNLMVRLYAMTVLLSEHGWVNTALRTLGFIDAPLPLAHSATAVYLGFVYWNLPFMAFPILASLDRMDLAQIEASMDLGAGPVRTFLQVTLPHSLPGVFAGCVFCFVPTMGCFIIPEVLGGKSEVLIGNVITQQFTVVRNWPLGSALSTALIAIIMVFVFLYLRYGDTETGA